MVETCFRPFRFRVWASLALVVLLAGETIGGGSGSNFSRFSGDRPNSRMPHFPWSVPHNQLVAFVAVGAALLVCLLFVFAYLNARARFVLMDSVVQRDCRLGEMWRRWREPAHGYFSFALLIMLVSLSVASAAGFWIWRAVAFHESRSVDFLSMIGSASSAAALVVFSVIFFLIVAVVWLFAKDFVVPIMAFENQSISDAWTRLRNIIAADPGAFILYIIARVIVTIACVIIGFMILLPVLIVLAIPLGIMVAVFVIAFKGSMAAIGLGIVLAVLLFVPLLLFVVGFVNVPFGIFFEAFALEFISYRVPPLAAALRPLPPAPFAPPLATLPDIPPEPNPI
ncbi:MAG: hypothetical protein NVS9B15_13050 [Acidobacteriaceae bacterium]